jgi:glycosyltransferase involved in cell wall biosynthesis
MNIAIIGPSPIPFTMGGMEYLLRGLENNISELSNHKVELIKLPTKEDNFWNIIDSYKQFYNLNLDHFDMVISTKYPAWMVRHRNHICYMAHRLRGLYDTYHFTKLPFDVDRKNAEINKVLDYLDSSNTSIDRLLELLETLRKVKKNIPDYYFALPSPFLRKIIHFLDDQGLKKIKKFYSISQTVKNRKEYFPENSEVEVLYPPSFLKNLSNGKYEYLFTISRLDSAKRVQLIVEAMKYVKDDIKLKIAGTGPMEKELKKIAGNDKRIEFLGFISDREAEKYYSNSKGVLYIPYEEDYGLVTIEAMMCEKPVITCSDSGGALEFVVDGKTGFISNPNAKEIGKKISQLSSMNNDELNVMGKNCFEKVKKITWKNVVENLLNNKEIKSNEKKKKITVTSTFSIYPPRGGGQARVYNIYKNIAQHYDVDIVSFGEYGASILEKSISENLREIRIPKTIKHQEEEGKIESKIGIPITDVVMPMISKFTPEYGERLKKSLESSDIVVASHPYLLHEIKKYAPDKPLIYEAQDVEYLIKKEIFPNCTEAKKILEIVFKMEKQCCEDSEFIMTCSEEDKKSISDLYKIPLNKIFVVPNGVDTGKTKYFNINERNINKRNLKLENEKLGIFIGSWHPPNIEACEVIFKIAEKCQDTKFLLIGSQCMALDKNKVPKNVALMGVVSEEVKNRIFGVADFALNPMLSGSGTNLKMFDYMAAGIPVITTEFGTRGFENKDLFYITDISNMHNIINNFNLSENEKKINEQRKYVVDHFDWKIISNNILNDFKKI